MNDEIIEEFEIYMYRDMLNDKTIKAYKSDSRKFLEFLDKDIRKITDVDVIKYKKELTGRTIRRKGQSKQFAGKSINRKFYAISKFIDFLNDTYRLNINLAIKKLKIKVEESLYGLNILTKTDVKKLYNAALYDKNYSFAALIKTLSHTGMRISEALRMKINDIDKKSIVVIGKHNRERVIPLPIALRDNLKEYMEVRHIDTNEDPIFINMQGNKLTAQMADYYLKKYARKSKVSLEKAHCHNFRHFFAYIALNEMGMSLIEVSMLLGHSTVKTTQIYLKESEKKLINNMQDFHL